jgi:hypothetical protein
VFADAASFNSGQAPRDSRPELSVKLWKVAADGWAADKWSYSEASLFALFG